MVQTQFFVKEIDHATTRHHDLDRHSGTNRWLLSERTSRFAIKFVIAIGQRLRRSDAAVAIVGARLS